MAVAGAVVGQDALLRRGLDELQVELDRCLGGGLLRAGHAGGCLEHVERRAGVAGADGDEVLARVFAQADPSAEAAGSSSARSTMAPTSSSDSGSRRNTRRRDRSAELTSK